MNRDERKIRILEEVIHSVWIHGDWRYLTSQMTWDQKEAAADAVENASHDPIESTLRWWRD